MLRRRVVFLKESASFFYDGDRPPRAEELEDPFRRGVLLIARANGEAELRWLRTTLESLDGHL